VAQSPSAAATTAWAPRMRRCATCNFGVVPFLILAAAAAAAAAAVPPVGQQPAAVGRLYVYVVRTSRCHPPFIHSLSLSLSLSFSRFSDHHRCADPTSSSRGPAAAGSVLTPGPISIYACTMHMYMVARLDNWTAVCVTLTLKR
jgi:hypothetical protein